MCVCLCCLCVCVCVFPCMCMCIVIYSWPLAIWSLRKGFDAWPRSEVRKCFYVPQPTKPFEKGTVHLAPSSPFTGIGDVRADHPSHLLSVSLSQLYPRFFIPFCNTSPPLFPYISSPSPSFTLKLFIPSPPNTSNTSGM